MRISKLGNTQQISKQQGFTLIELVVVIVILGILAVTAAPRFIDVQVDARTATLDAVKASVESVATMIHAKALISGQERDATATVTVNRVPVTIRFGYPRDDSAAALAHWQNDLLDLDESEFTIVRSNGAIIITPNGIVLSGPWPVDPAAPLATERNCYVHYQQSDVAGDPPLAIYRVQCL